MIRDTTLIVMRNFKRPMRRQARVLPITGFCLLLAGCAVGPDFHRPSAPKVTGYTTEPLTGQTAAADGTVQSFLQGADIPAQWWTLFHSKSLNQLVEEALKANPDLKAAKAALIQAQENTYAAEGVFFPSLDAKGLALRQKTSSALFGRANGGSSKFNLFNASVDVSYVFDVFGGERRNVESLKAQAESERFQLEAAYLTLASNVVTAAIQEASLRGQIAATREIVDAEKKQLDLLRRQFNLGGASMINVLTQKTRLAQTRATLPPLKKQLALVRNQLAALSGRFPSQGDRAIFELSALRLPRKLPVSLPSRLVRQRPDIRSAEAELHVASAKIGVATADFFPKFTISGSYGSVVTQAGNIFSPGAGVWNIGTNLLQPILHGGTTIHHRRAAVAAYKKAANLYQSAVLTAFRNVADVLRSLQSDAEALQAKTHAVEAVSEQLNMAREQFRVGAIDYLSLLDAQRSYEQERVSFVQAQANRYADTAALFQALGGGWWNRTAAASTEQHAQNTEDGK